LAGAEGSLFGVRQIARVAVLAPAAPLLGTEVIECSRARDSTEPRAGAPSPGIEAPPDPKRLLEGLPRQVFGHRPVTGEKEQVAVPRIQLGLGDCRERRTIDPQGGPRGC